MITYSLVYIIISEKNMTMMGIVYEISLRYMAACESNVCMYYFRLKSVFRDPDRKSGGKGCMRHKVN